MLSALVAAGRPPSEGRKETTHNSISVVRGVGDERVRERREDPVMRRAWMGGGATLHAYTYTRIGGCLQAAGGAARPVMHGGGAGRGKMRGTRRAGSSSGIQSRRCGPSRAAPRPDRSRCLVARTWDASNVSRPPREPVAPGPCARRAATRPLPFPLPCASKADEMESLRRAPGPGPGQTYPIPARLSGESDRAGRQARARPT